jgi:cytochrome c oxidase cbb3-type subunit III
MSDNKRIDAPTGTSTVGHEWDGIEELDTPMPRWWVFTFWATIIWAIGYVIVYPAIPMLNSATPGLWNWSSRSDLSRDIAADAKRRAKITAVLATTPVELLAQNPKLQQAAVEGGRAAFKVHCVQCHGSGAVGSKGYPNLNDDDWLWGGDITAIHYSITHGIRNPDHAETRTSQMPAFGGVLNSDEISSVVAFVRTISGQTKASGLSAKGAALFANNCAACHGPDGKGGREFGAPNLTDAIWLYGGDSETIRMTITKSRSGVMPRWANRLDGVTIKMLASYVHSLGGGEAIPAPTAAAVENATPKIAANVQP